MKKNESKTSGPWFVKYAGLDRKRGAMFYVSRNGKTFCRVAASTSIAAIRKAEAIWRKQVAEPARLADLDKVNRKLAKATKAQRAAYAADARKAAGVSKTQPRGLQGPKRGVSGGQPDAKPFPPTHPAYKLAEELAIAGLLNGEAGPQAVSRVIQATAEKLGKAVRVPCLRFDLYFVGHGYQVDVFVNGKDAGVGGCQDFGGTYAVSYVKDEFYKAILSAIDKAGRKL